MTQATAPAFVTVAHRLPGRLRLRLPRGYRPPSLLAAVRDAVLALPGVSRVEVDAATGSVLVLHDQTQASCDRIGCAVASTAGLSFQSPDDEHADAPSARAAAPAVPPARSLRAVAAAANRTVRGLTGGLFDLRFLVPAALAAIALYQVNRTGTGLLAPPYTLLWYAFSLFMTFNVK